ncbi:uncharacterized protein FOMMEDRAFT_149738 [Fomitiporia mediterranea MF3/22]|uniref:uncharacterized protein n=1 Tax=Fomitiporia mediterranea (strain MF3/22) TaxID=694068 RepID=UPI00044097E6|nr:uncharacterized protein FOMMEDRAFT_149738 [Fomitiporia mediterranea MF3/22]EJD07227.1 hypothetical protein FOMMEDRAFT_149738 [Fomitiporia mediterranea MF3/22]
MIENPCKLLCLPEEILIEIICCCDVEDVVRLSMTCKYLREICFLRPIWLSLIQDLDITQAPDISTHQLPDNFATEELYKKAITAVRNARAWRTPGGLRFGQEVSIHIDPVTQGVIEGDLPGEGNERVDPRLLPGGKYALIENHGRLELWSLFPRARVWIANPSREADCIAFDFEIVDGGESMNIAVLFLNVATGCFVQVYKFEFQTQQDELLREYNLPMVFFFRLMIRGDLVMIHMPHSVQLTLLNWMTGNVLLLNFTNSEGRRTNARAALIADQHLIVVMHLGALTLTAIPLDSLAQHWSNGHAEGDGTDITFTHATITNPDPVPQPETDIDTPTRPNHALRLRLAEPTADDEEEPYILALHAFTPVWQRDALNESDALVEIYVVAYDNLQNKKKKSLLSYRVQLTRMDKDISGSTIEQDPGVREVSNGQWRLRLVQQTRAPASKLPWNSQSISNAGTMFSMTDKFNCYTLFSPSPQPSNVLPITPTIIPENVDADPAVVNVEPTSGALAVGTPGLLRVLRIKE